MPFHYEDDHKHLEDDPNTTEGSRALPTDADLIRGQFCNFATNDNDGKGGKEVDSYLALKGNFTPKPTFMKLWSYLAQWIEFGTHTARV